jgi:solute carrier family 8 (sodium/calcium exchanger)
MVGIWGGIFLIWVIAKGDFEDPDCPTEDEMDAEVWTKMVILTGKSASPKMCEPCGGGGLLLPVFAEYELSISKGVRAALYLIGLLWIFLGIGIVCDQFMGAIEEITSKDRVVWLLVAKGTKHKFHVRVWNGTVANLTLMALGSSAPEILLNVVEIMGNSFFAGELGPSTIVGSAAFNLLVITAVCISALPPGETRKIDGVGVFGITASMSIFAYIWLIVILQFITADRVDLWEALVTFAFFPFLVILAFAADRGLFAKMLPSTKVALTAGENDGMLDKFGDGASKEAMAAMAAKNAKKDEPKGMSKAAIRKALMSSVTGGNKGGGDGDKSGDLTVGFAKQSHVVSEGAGNFFIKVVANKAPGIPISVSYVTVAGSAKEGLRYEKSEGTLEFTAYQVENTISVPIIDNDVFEPEDEIFYVQLSNLVATPQGSPGLQRSDSMKSNSAKKMKLKNPEATVAIQNDDMPGTISFDTDELYIVEEKATLHVSRNYGTTSRITFRARTVDGTALQGKDYIDFEDEIVMEDGQATTTIEIQINPGTEASDEKFRVVLDQPSQGVKFDKDRDGGEDSAICEIIIGGNAGSRSCMQLFIEKVYNHDIFMRNMGCWGEQFTAAFYCNGSARDQSEAAAGDWFFHFLSFVFKALFAFVPPPGFAGGWACFWMALIMIGTVTVFVGDMAGLLGCCLGLSDDITAITLVALGTSLPDTFASKVAAQENPNADDSIGNVTGSNSVNVFLGLGLPWSIGALYWASQGGRNADWDKHKYKGDRYTKLFVDNGGPYPDGGFMVPAGSLSFSVLVFTFCALCCVGLLILRRFVYGAELGGSPFVTRRDSAILVFLWFVYVTFSILKSTGTI